MRTTTLLAAVAVLGSAVPTIAEAAAAPAAALPQQQPLVQQASETAQQVVIRNGTADTVLPERELNGHYFLAPLSLQLPLITSHVSSSTGVAATDFSDIPDGEGGDMTLGFFTLAQIFEVQIGLYDRVALRGFIQGAATAPSEVDSAFLLAVDGGSAGGAGATVQAFKNRYFAVAGSFDWTHNQNVSVTPLIYLGDLMEKLAADLEDESLDGGWEADPDLLFSELSSDTLAFSAQAAAAPHELVGFFGEIGWNAETSEGRDDAFLRMGGGASLNFNGVGIPVGVLGYYVERFAMDSENSTELDRLIAGGLYYTGRRYLDLGLEMQVGFNEIDDVDSMSTGVAARVRTYF